MEFAVIKTGGKQYKVSPGDVIKIEKTKGDFKKGDDFAFEEVLLTSKGKDLVIGSPMIKGGAVKGTFVEAGRNKKIDVIKYKQKSRYFKKNGHRQPYFKIKIETI
jgi:large subunit ribosomal protein L21